MNRLKKFFKKIQLYTAQRNRLKVKEKGKMHWANTNLKICSRYIKSGQSGLQKSKEYQR